MQLVANGLYGTPTVGEVLGSFLSREHVARIRTAESSMDR
ncbi:hypothetical protein AT864_00320 [Anoxybacillus sp. P3H1B]|jgi:hypothetical protein|nr:hypothetical protein AT864_00320 [Anoxybacillus sp. P3H1B]MBB3906815.1 hypothetical protein [Anoxybacillus rupiensis]